MIEEQWAACLRAFIGYLSESVFVRRWLVAKGERGIARGLLSVETKLLRGETSQASRLIVVLETLTGSSIRLRAFEAHVRQLKDEMNGGFLVGHDGIQLG